MVTERRLRLTGYSPGATEAVVQLDRIEPARRARRALGGFALWMLAALVTLFLPVAHLILVPTALIGAVVTLVMRATTRTRVASAWGTCPDCGTAQQLDVGGAWRLPKDIACRHCHRRLTLHE